MYVFTFNFLVLFLVLFSPDVSERKLAHYFTILIIKDIIKN